MTEGLWTPKFPASYSQPSITHYCTFLLKDPLPLVVVLCIITVSVRAETRHMSYRIRASVRTVIPNTRKILKEWVHPSSPGGWEMGWGELTPLQGGHAHLLLLLLLLRGEGERDWLRDVDLDE